MNLNLIKQGLEIPYGFSADLQYEDAIQSYILDVWESIGDHKYLRSARAAIQPERLQESVAPVFYTQGLVNNLVDELKEKVAIQ